MLRKSLLVLALLLAVPPAPAQERVDLSAINRIKTEAFDNSRVMDYIFYLTDVNGHRLTGSPGYKAAGDWAVKTLRDIGVGDPRQEAWGPFNRGWDFSYFSGHMVAPVYSTLIGAPVAWTPGTDGPVTGDAMVADIKSAADFEKFKGKLAGKMVLLSTERELTPAEAPLFTRYTPQQLSDIATLLIPRRRPPQDSKFQEALDVFLKSEAPKMIVQNSARGESGTVFGGGARQRDAKDNIPAVVIATEQYNRIARLLAHDPPIPVKLQFDVKSRYYDDTRDSFNVIGEIPGGAKKGEVVMLGGHLDSWHYGTGATDDAIGVATALETMRILKALGVKMDRTVRVALWGGEEQGLLGSKAYVKQRFADPEVMKPSREHEQLSAYFNIDNGAGKIRGIYCEGNDMVKPILEAWLAPFSDMGATVVTGRATTGTDHQSFDAVGLPAFQFIQDPLDYMARTHHSNMDVYDRIQRNDAIQIAAIEASFVYLAATRPEKLPRKPLPKPRPAQSSSGTPR